MSDITSKLAELDEMFRKADEHTQHDDGDVCCYCNRPMGVRDDLDPVPYCWLCGTDKYETVRAAYPDLSNAIRTLTRERDELASALDKISDAEMAYQDDDSAVYPTKVIEQIVCSDYVLGKVREAAAIAKAEAK